MKLFVEDLLLKFSNNSFFKNLLLIFSGEGMTSVLGFLSTMFIINSLGSSQHGVLIAVQTYANLFYSFFSFKTFQALIKYLAKANKNHDKEKAKLYIKWAFILDIICLFATFLFGTILKDFIIQFMGWNSSISHYCSMYLFIYMLYFQGTTIGVLRFFEKYRYVVVANLIGAVIKCVGFLVCMIFDKNFLFFFVIDCTGNLIKFILMDFFTIRTLIEQNLFDFFHTKLYFCHDFLEFSFFSNITSTIDLPVNQITSLIINKYLGFEATSVYNVFGNIGAVINRLGDPISQIIYPEMNKLISDNKVTVAKQLSNKLKICMLILFIFTSLFVITTNSLWLDLFISNPEPYIGSLILYIGFSCYVNSAMGTHNLFMALGYVKYNIPILLVVNSLYIILLIVAVRLFGLNGVIFVYFLQAVAVVIIKEIIMRSRNFEVLM